MAGVAKLISHMKTTRKKAPVRREVQVRSSTPAVAPSSVIDTLRRMAAIQEEIEALQGEYEGVKGRL